MTNTSKLTDILLEVTYLASGELLQEGISLISFAENKIGSDFNLNSSILGRNKSLVGPEVFGISIQGLKKILRLIYSKITNNLINELIVC